MIEEDEPPPGSRGLLKAISFLGIVSLGVGVYHGFCNAQGKTVTNEELKFWLSYGPAIVQGSIAGLFGGLAGLIYGAKEAGHQLDPKDKNYELKGFGGALLGGGMTATLGGASGATMGYLETLVGYGLGYTVGYFTK